MNTEAESFIARWSRRKRAAEEAKQSADDARHEPSPAAPASTAAGSLAPSPVSGSAPSEGSARAPEVALPPLESLDGLRSDYQAFFQQPVSDDLRHAALKKLFADPHFNKMDMLDVYVDDYTQFEPLPATLRMRLPSARAFLSDAERSEVEVAEAGTAQGVTVAPAAEASDAVAGAPPAEQSAAADAIDSAAEPPSADASASAAAGDADRTADAPAAQPDKTRRVSDLPSGPHVRN